MYVRWNYLLWILEILILVTRRQNVCAVVCSCNRKLAAPTRRRS